MDAARIAAFAQALRAKGVPVSPDATVRYARALLELDPADPEDLYWAGRATLIFDPAHFGTYDTVFATFCGDSRAALQARPTFATEGPPGEVGDALPSPAPDSGRSEGAERGSLQASTKEILREKRFDRLDEDEAAALAEIIRRLIVDTPRRSSRRRTTRRRGSYFDVRTTLRRAVSTGGEPLRPATTGRRLRPRSLVMLLDVSGSMRKYSRFLLQFAHAASRGGVRTEIFCFGTRLTRVSRAVARSDPDKALTEVATIVPDWEGGTRIGASLGTFIDDWGRLGVSRGAVVLICSDGMERGDPETLRREMLRLSRLAYSVVWVNPLKGDPRYLPSARGMAAALPFIDLFLPGHNLASLEDLALLLRDLTSGRRVPSMAALPNR